MCNSRGPKRPLTKDQAQAIQHYLIREECWRDLAMFMVGIDSHLRACDLLRLTVKDVVDIHGHIRSHIVGCQKKTKRTYEGYLSQPTREALSHWINVSGKQPPDCLFTRLRMRNGKFANSPISREAYANRVKMWVTAIGLDPAVYSTKTLRKSRIRPILEAANYDYQIPQIILCHADIRSTIHYCEVARDTALAISKQIQFFKSMNLTTSEGR